MSLLPAIREGLRDPFAQTIALPSMTLTRAEARAVERALAGQQRKPRRFGAFRIVFRGIQIQG